MHGMLAKVKEERAQRALSQWKHTAVKPAGGGPASAPDASPVPGGASGAPAASVPPPARGKQSASALKTSALAPAMMATVAAKRSVAIDAKSTPMEAAAGGASASTGGPARLDSLGSNRAERLGKSKGRKSARSLYNDDEFAPTPR